MAEIIDGRAVADEIYGDLARRVAVLAGRGITPGLAVILVGDDPASRIYVNMKKKACARLGMLSQEHLLGNDAGLPELLALVDRLNADPAIHGILVQLPLPAGFDAKAVISAISPDKDVDGLHPVNAGRLLTGEKGFLPCTPAGVIELIRSTGIDMAGKRAVVVGRSSLVGKPAALLLLRENATVTICHSRTADLPAVCREGDILVAAMGKAEFITGDMIKPGAVVIDVGTSKVDGRLLGDVHFATAAGKAAFITPVPGGVGPMTIVMLMRNTIEAAEASL